MTRDSVAPISGTGSLKVTITDDIGGQGVFQTVQLDNSVGAGDLTGQTWRLTWDYKSTEGMALTLYLDMQGASDLDDLWEDTGTAAVQSASVDVVIPVGASETDVSFFTSWDGGNEGVFWIDNVRWVKISDAP